MSTRTQHGITSVMQRWKKDEHAARLERRNFRYTRELVLHHTEPGTAARWIGAIK